MALTGAALASVACTPPPVEPTRTVVAAVSVGTSHACEVTASGGVRCWGDNAYGQLGNGESGNVIGAPIDVVGLPAAAVAVEAGAYMSCAVLVDTTVRCWGRGDDGRLGTGSTGSSPVPLTVVHATAGGSGAPAPLTGVRSIASGQGSTTPSFPYDVGATCAVTAAGSVFCWGSNDHGQLGDGGTPGFTGAPSASAVQVPGLADATQVSVGLDAACARTATGRLVCWGNDDRHQLGFPAIMGTVPGAELHAPPTMVLADDTSGVALAGVQQVTMGMAHTCATVVPAIVPVPIVQCWGDSSWGQSGVAAGGVITNPRTVASITGGWRSVAAASVSSCAVTAIGGIRCWGSNAVGQLGIGTHEPFGSSATPVDVLDLQSGVASVDGGLGAVCSVTDAGDVVCWGHNDTGQLGRGFVSLVEARAAAIEQYDAP